MVSLSHLEKDARIVELELQLRRTESMYIAVEIPRLEHELARLRGEIVKLQTKEPPA